MVLNKAEVLRIQSGAIRCDGTVNLDIEFNDGRVITLYCLTLKQADNVEWSNWVSLHVDDRMLTRSFEQEMRQNDNNY